MNLFTKSIAKCVISEWERSLKPEEGLCEARFIVQSLSPDSVFILFQELDAHRLLSLRDKNITCYFRVATELWRDWCRSPSALDVLDQKMSEIGAIGENGERLWIDEEDRLTWFRNRTVETEKSDALVIVLVGLNHTTDKGGLADFYKVDENRVWQDLGQSFIPWINQITDKLSLSEDGGVRSDDLDEILLQLLKLRPFSLAKMSDFLDQIIEISQKSDYLIDFTSHLLKGLPYWDIPPLFTENTPSLFKHNNIVKILKDADGFISHKRYKTKKNQKNDCDKIDSAIKNGTLSIPAGLQGQCKRSLKP